MATLVSLQMLRPVQSVDYPDTIPSCFNKAPGKLVNSSSSYLLPHRYRRNGFTLSVHVI
jgi:hypothetical protein